MALDKDLTHATMLNRTRNWCTCKLLYTNLEF